jgi:hypothetical protein
MRPGLQVSSPSGELWARSARRISCAAWRSDSERRESSPSADTVPRTNPLAREARRWGGGKLNVGWRQNEHTRRTMLGMTFEWHAPVRLGVRVAHRDNEAS